jgi:hypothetical protein
MRTKRPLLQSANSQDKNESGITVERAAARICWVRRMMQRVRGAAAKLLQFTQRVLESTNPSDDFMRSNNVAADITAAIRHHLRSTIRWLARAVKLSKTPRFKPKAKKGNEDRMTIAEVTDRDKAQCVEYAVRSWRLYIALQQQYRPLPLAENMDKFTRSIVRDLAKNFVWVEQETKIQVLAIIFAAIIRSGTHPESETRDAIKGIWPRLLEEVRWPL